MEKFFVGIFWLAMACIFWYNGANEFINERDSFLLSFIVGNIYLASATRK